MLILQNRLNAYCLCTNIADKKSPCAATLIDKIRYAVRQVRALDFDEILTQLELMISFSCSQLSTATLDKLWCLRR